MVIISIIHPMPALAVSTVVCPRDPMVESGKVDVLQKICEAKKLLKSRQAKWTISTTQSKQMVCKGKGKKRKCQEKLVTKKFRERTILLASLSLETQVITMVEVPEKLNTKVNGYQVQRLSRDGVDSEFEITAPPGQIVLALQFPLKVKSAKGLVLERAVYVPYSREMTAKFPEIIARGRGYLAASIAAARLKIDAGGANLYTISDELVASLIMVEHFSREVVPNDEVEDEITKVLFTIGANGDEAYRYSVSGAGARGVAQMMPKTYRSLNKRYPKLLMADFYAGTANVPNAMVSQFLLAAEDLKFLFSQRGWDELRAEGFKHDARRMGAYLSVAYNGGAPRAARWEDSGQVLPLPAESAKYVVKFHQVWNKRSKFFRK
jgi:hypothetical protein